VKKKSGKKGRRELVFDELLLVTIPGVDIVACCLAVMMV
jgi:hypothetical protein